MESPAALYTPILRASWHTARTAWRRWPYALLAGLLIGTGIGSALLQTLGTDPTQGSIGILLDPERGIYAQAGGLWALANTTGTSAAVLLVGFGTLVTAVILALFWFAVCSTNALVLAAADDVAGIPAVRTFRRARTHVASTAAVHILATTATVTILAAWSALFTWAAAFPSPRATVFAIVGFVVTALLLSILHLATPYAIVAITVDARPFVPAVREAFALLRDRWLITVEASLLLSAANVIAFLAWLLGSMVLIAPFALLVGVSVAERIPALTFIAFAAGILTLLVYLIAVVVIFTTFLITAWTRLSLRLTTPGTQPEAWLARRFER